MKKLLYNLARKIVANRIITGTQLTSKHLEDKGWIYRYDKIHYYKIYHCFQDEYEEIDPFVMTYFATDSSVE